MNGYLSQGNLQLDIPLVGQKYVELDHSMPGWRQAIDYAFFNNLCNLDPSKYEVIVESNDVNGPRFRKIGSLQRQVLLPLVRFDPYARIGVVPKECGLPAFEARLTRGGTYTIPRVPMYKSDKPVTYAMERSGVDFF